MGGWPWLGEVVARTFQGIRERDFEMRMIHIVKRLIYGVLTLAICGGLSAQEEGAKPNVVFICSDDMRPDLGCYGVEWMKTPHLDRLAKTGVPFLRHYVTVPTCGGSRRSLLTGLRPSAAADYGNQSFGHHGAELAESPTESFVHMFRQQGYYTVGTGKICHNHFDPAKQIPRSWDEIMDPSGEAEFPSENDFPPEENLGTLRQEQEKKRRKDKKKSHLKKGYPFSSRRDGDDRSYPDGILTDLAVAKLSELKGREQPFFLGIGYRKPHLPFNAPKKYWDLYDPKEIPLPDYGEWPVGTDGSTSIHDSFELRGQYMTPEGFLDDPEYCQSLRHGYAACVSYVDAQVGEIMRELDRLDLRKNTIVVFWGDHGWHLGEHGTYGKHTAFERAVRSPLLVNVPDARGNGQSCNALIETVDIYPTLAELCGLNPPDGLAGESFVNLLNQPDARGPEEAFSYTKVWSKATKHKGALCKTMRTENYRFSVWRTGLDDGEVFQVELYDHGNDPNETRNLAEEQPELVQAMFKRMNNDGIPWGKP